MGHRRKTSSSFPPADRPSLRPTDVVTIVLAAGKGERIGGPKALLAWPKPGAVPPPEPSRPAAGRPAGARPQVEVVPLAIAHAEARLAAESARVLVVVRASMLTSLLGYVKPGIDLLSSTAADDLGPAGSLAFAVSRLPPVSTVIVTPVDTPPARAAVVARLLARLEAGDPPPLAVRPRVGGRTGHPVVLRPAALDVYRLASPPPLRDHLRTLGARVVDEDVEDPSVLADLDTSADVVRVLGQPPRFLG
jgi:CTP:molybdopterin cytidylyltransferase MocA